ncbi:MAG TPA: Gfo/Idh/MocA family oxidoreductase [Capillimicrobium sp.]|nr:Gfo/Idh/MocA family oxidoreductase [Capillimicrobium sp.]
MQPRTVNVGVIGAGFMGKAHSLAYAAMPMFFWPAPAVPRRAIIAEVTDDLAAEAAARFGYERSTGDWRRVVEDPDVDLVDIAVPNDAHPEIAIAAVEAGKHVICEKPLARTGAEARRMRDAAVAAGVVHMVAFNYRRTPAVALAKKLIEDGTIGTVRNFRGTYLQDWSLDPDLPLSWRFSRDVAGSGALGDIATHVLDFARYLVGEVSEVNAMWQRYIHDRPIPQGGADQLAGAAKLSDAPRGPVDVDDEVMTLLRFADGAVGSIEATRHAHGRKNFLTFEIHGDRGTLAFDYERRDELRLYSADDGADRQGFRTMLTGPAHPYGEALWPIPGLGIGYGETKIIECYELMRAIADGVPADPSFEDGYAISAIADAIAHSAETGGGWTAVELDAAARA